MIPKAEILEFAKHYSLLPTTVQKDYVLGWVLRAIANHSVLSQWVFKGGTCLKKCYFETYRFSEDLDFTIPPTQGVSYDQIDFNLNEAITWIENNSGITFPQQDRKIEEYSNPRGNISYQVKISYNGPLGGPPKSLPRIKFDLTQDELLVDEPVKRKVHHTFSDTFIPDAEVLCYSINEILAEKSRALMERNGRARDVYDVVNMSRSYRDKINPQYAKQIANSKFGFKGLQNPNVQDIVSSIDRTTLQTSWEHQLSHQISNLPPFETYFDDLEDALAWWLQPELAHPELQPIPEAQGESISRIFFPTANWRTGPTSIDLIRQAARNRFCALISYHGSMRLIEPYSLRYPRTGNEILHAWEIKKNGFSSNQHKSFKTNEISTVSISDRTFIPKWIIEF
jgi:predicted nucleotidyltransferase component of viral defense system